VQACPLNPSPRPVTGQQELLNDFSKRFSPAIRGVVEFAKRIPGFGLLAQDDQVTLLKAGVFEVLLVRLACMFDSEVSVLYSNCVPTCIDTYIPIYTRIMDICVSRFFRRVLTSIFPLFVSRSVTAWWRSTVKYCAENRFAHTLTLDSSPIPCSSLPRGWTQCD